MDNYTQPPTGAPYGVQPPVPPMSFGEAIQTCFNKYATFSGRAGRAEFWYWYLFSFIISAAFTSLTLIFKGSFMGSLISGFEWLANIALLIPSLAVSWRRMHDIGKGGGWFFINLIPIVGNIIWIIWCIKPGEPYPNRFGSPV